MLTLNLNVHNETSNLKSVYVGIADDFGNTPKKRIVMILNHYFMSKMVRFLIKLI